jgi:two-component system, NtrC family, response regulator HydG
MVEDSFDAAQALGGVETSGGHEPGHVHAPAPNGKKRTMDARILVVDDDQSMCDLLEASLSRFGYEVETRTSARDALELVAAVEFDAVLTDLDMADLGGLDLCERVMGTRPDVPVIVVTAHGSLEAAIGAMRVGAYDFLTKPVDGKLLAIGVARAVQHRKLKSELQRLRLQVSDGGDGLLEGFIGDSVAMRRVYDLVHRVGASDASVLVHGETGTGKELIAKAIHDRSPRKTGPFVAINCAAVPATLLESELFGHAKGAFTDARSARQGLFQQANGGTLFLDEIGEMPIEIQPKLLRALQEKRVRPVGSNAEIPFDARLVAATNRNLEDEVYEKRFREDLFYRINVVKIDLPPLRERGADVLALARFFLDRAAARAGSKALTLSTPAAEKLMSYAWPGNVRELENCMERVVALARFDHVTVEDLPEKIRAYRAERFVVSADDTDEIVTIDELERRYIMRVLSLLGGNKSRAAQLLGLDRRTLYRKLDRYERGGNGEAAQRTSP